MLKKKLRQILKDNNLYHIFIEIKNTLKITRIVTKLLIEHQNGKIDHTEKLWVILMWQQWLNEWL